MTSSLTTTDSAAPLLTFENLTSDEAFAIISALKPSKSWAHIIFEPNGKVTLHLRPDDTESAQ